MWKQWGSAHILQQNKVRLIPTLIQYSVDGNDYPGRENESTVALVPSSLLSISANYVDSLSI